MKSKDTKHQKCKRGKHVTGQTHVTNSQAVVHERDLATAIPIISGNGLPFLAQNNFQTPLLFGLPCLLIFRVSVGPPFY